jgi:hypothetical protein
MTIHDRMLKSHLSLDAMHVIHNVGMLTTSLGVSMMLYGNHLSDKTIHLTQIDLLIASTQYNNELFWMEGCITH